VVENILVARDPGLSQKSAENLEAAFNRTGVAALASQKAQQDFGMKVLADFVDYANILQQRLRFVTGERDRLIAFQRTQLAIVVFVVNFVVNSVVNPSSAQRRNGVHAESGKRGEFGVAGA